MVKVFGEIKPHINEEEINHSRVAHESLAEISPTPPTGALKRSINAWRARCMI